MRPRFLLFLATALFVPLGCSEDSIDPGDGDDGLETLDPQLVEEGRDVFRYDDFGSHRFWTDTLGLNDLVEGVSPELALQLGLKVDRDAVPTDVLNAVLNDPALLADPAVTRQLLQLDAVVGLSAEVEGDQITRMGITCALCHSNVDDAVTAGIGSRLDGWVNRDLSIGTIISLAPGLPEEARELYASWPVGFFDPRFDQDGINGPVIIPPAYGLNGVPVETYTGEGPVSYWNQYVAILEMHGVGSFAEPELGISVSVPASEDRVAPVLEALRHYQLSLHAPPPPPGSWDQGAAARGALVFSGAGQCSTCHSGPRFTDGAKLHAPAATGSDPAYAARGTTGRYRATPLRSLWQHAPYFHDGSAATLSEVVIRYNDVLGLGLTGAQQADLVEYLRSL